LRPWGSESGTPGWNPLVWRSLPPGQSELIPNSQIHHPSSGLLTVPRVVPHGTLPIGYQSQAPGPAPTYSSFLSRFMFRFQVKGRGFIVSDSQFRVSIFTFQVSGFRFQVSILSFKFQVSCSEFQVSRFKFQVSCFGFHVSNFKFHVSGFKFQGLCSEF
jgi:hypothetical protein